MSRNEWCMLFSTNALFNVLEYAKRVVQICSSLLLNNLVSNTYSQPLNNLETTSTQPLNNLLNNL